jgi:hypothetical protein
MTTMTPIRLDTYEVTIDGLRMEALGSSAEDALDSLKEWLDKYTNGYTQIKEIRLLRREEDDL